MDRTDARVRIGDPVLALLSAIGLLAAAFLPFLSHAPNRIVAGRPIALHEAIGGAGLLALLPGLMLVAGILLRPGRGADIAKAMAGAAFVLALLFVAGGTARDFADPAFPGARTSLGSGFWVLAATGWLAAADAAGRLDGSMVPRLLLTGGICGGVAMLLVGGLLEDLAVLKEFHAREDIFLPALARHAQIVALALVPTLAIGLPLGVLARRRAMARGAIFGTLNIIQTIPSIALFGLLMVPLSGLAAAFPLLGAHGISGIGLAPATIALALYSLLPIARATEAGLAQVPASARDAATGLGFTPAEAFWQIEVPLALPVLLSGLRIALVQAIGLAALASLIGAGGLGAIMFQGLFSSALDLVLLGVIPIVAMALVADAVLKAATAFVGRRGR